MIMNWYQCGGKAVLRRYEARERVQRRKRTFAWEKMDEELLPKVRETIALLQGAWDDTPAEGHGICSHEEDVPAG